MLCSLIDNLIMKILYLLFSIHFYISYASSRTIHADGIIREDAVPKDDLQIKLKQDNDNNIIWTKVETQSALVSRQDENSSREELISKISLAPLEHKEKEKSVGMTMTESPFPENNSVHDPRGFLGNHSKDNSNSTGLSDALVTENFPLSVLTEWDSRNISDVMVFDFEEENEATVAEILIESVQPVEHINSNGTFIIMEDVDSFQEVSTFGFEFLIDSETTRNSLVSDLLISQNNSIIDDLNDELTSLFMNWEESSLEDERFGAVNSSSVNENSITLFSSKNESENLGSEKGNITDFGFTSSEQTEITEKITPACPEPGWCFFWLFAEDTCAEDHHCLGSRICCKLGCVKTCVDV